MAFTLSRNGHFLYGSAGTPDCYPKSTSLAAAELSSQGFDATVPTLNYLIKQGIVALKPDGRNYEWLPKEIDRAVDYFDEKSAYSAFGHANQMHGIDAQQYHRGVCQGGSNEAQRK